MTGLRLDGLHAAPGGSPVLHGIDLRVARGELVVVLGPSGAGKSTLLRVIAGLEPATRGSVHIAGRDVTGDRPGRRNVAMVFQSYALFPHLTARQNIAFGLAVRKGSRGEIAGQVRAAAVALGCVDLLDRRPHQLSGGERQRVALARVLVRAPDAFLLDEPMSNLDAELRIETRAELRALHERVGAATVHVTHDQTEALVLGDRVAVLHAGRLEQVGTPDEIWRRPATTFVARFVGSPAMNLLPAGSAVVAAPSTPDRLVGFRPEAVVLGEPAGVEATVERVDVVGEDAYAYLRAGADPIVARVRAAERPRAGGTVSVAVRAADVHVFDAVTGRRV